MLMLAADPGETLGWVLVKFELNQLEVIDATQIKLSTNERGFEWESVSEQVRLVLSQYEPDIIVLEDYRVYPSKATAHIGARLLTSELIGAICQEASVNQLPVVRIPASRKGLWPKARLTAKFPFFYKVPQPHAGDALILALIHAEDRGWKP